MKGNGQGVENCKLYCCSHASRDNTSGESRFDWIEVIQDGEKVFVQLNALIEFVKGRKSKLLYFGNVTSKLNPTSSLSKAPIFPELKYLTTVDHRLFTILDKVDSIILPACVFPISMNLHDYTVTDKRERVKSKFMYIPFEFMFRDDWGSATNVNIRADLMRNVHNSKSVKRYLIAKTKDGRDRLLNEIKDTLAENEFDTQEVDDEEIVRRRLEYRYISHCYELLK